MDELPLKSDFLILSKVLPKKQDVIESLIVFAFITGILLPVRLLFVAYVSDNWFGSFGIISAISISMIILAKKEKLGRLGQMIERQIEKYQRGKRGKIMYIQAIIFLTILGGTIFAIEAGNSYYLDLKNEFSTEYNELSDSEYILEQTQNISIHELLIGIAGLFLAVFVAFPQLSAMFAILNDTFDGWILHFYTVAFVEYLEIFGILILHRAFSNTKNFKKILGMKE